MTFDLFTTRSNLLPYAFIWAPYIFMGKMLRISNDFFSAASGPMLLKISCGAFLGWGKERLLKWLRSIDQDGRHAHIWSKSLKIFFSRTEDALGLNLCTNHQGREVYKTMMVLHCTLTFDFFTTRSSLLPYAFVWAPYICMGKMWRISTLKPLGQCCSDFMWSLLRLGV